ncbi:MAG: acyltransferase family protein [Terracidiphilus sp.]
MAPASTIADLKTRPSSRTGSSEPQRSYRPDIDGLRAIAILSVVLDHARVPFLAGGFTGVDIFFVISGYLIGGHIYAELRAGSFSYLRFYQRRAKRILPAFFVVLIFSLIAALILLSPGECADFGRSAFAATLSASNILFWGTTNYFAGKSGFNPLLMTWSLGVEEQFYAMIPLLMVLLARIRRNWILPATLSACVLSFAFAWAALHSRPMLVFYLLPARAWELGAGVALAIVELNRKRDLLSTRAAQWASLLGLTLLLAPLFLLTGTSAYPGPAALPSVIGAALAIAAPASWTNRKLLSMPLLVFVGKISYSFYLWHWPVLSFLHILYGGDAPGEITVAAIGVSFLAAVLTYSFIEQPFRRSRGAPAPLLIRYAAAGAAILAACAAVWLSRGFPQRFPQLAPIEAASRALKSDPCLAGYGKDSPNVSPACAGAASGGPSVALWGDSHAAALAPGVRSIASAQGYGFIQLGKAACPPMIGATHSSPRIPLLAGECMRFNRRVLDLIASDRQIKIVILNADWAGYLYSDWQDGWLTADLASANTPPAPDAARKLFLDSLSATIRSLQSAGKRVVIFSDVPTFEIDPIWRVRSRLIPARRGLASWLGVQDASDPGVAAPSRDPHFAVADSLLAQTVSRLPGVALVDLKLALCAAPAQCTYRQGDSLLYGDSNHLSTEGALYALRDFRFPATIATGR